MKFYEFGTENEKTLMLLHGNATTWEMSFAKCIPVLAEKYHVIAVGLDGYDPTEDTETISDEDEAEKIAACWYGEKEKNMKKAIIGLKKVFPLIEVKEFKGYGHGEILQHPGLLKTEIDLFVDA